MGNSTAKILVALDEKVAPYSGQKTEYLHDIGVAVQKDDVTVNFDPSMTASEIQKLIDAQYKFIPPGKTLTFQFADGTYTLTESLVFEGFFGGGGLCIYGNMTEVSDLHTNQAVFLDFSTVSGLNGIIIASCRLVNVKVYNLKIRAYGTGATDGEAVRVHGLSGISMRYCYLLGNSGSRAIIRFDRSRGQVYKTYFNGGAHFGIISAVCSNVYSNQNATTGTLPLYGLRAISAAVIAKNGTQPAGSTANEYASGGAVIR